MSLTGRQKFDYAMLISVAVLGIVIYFSQSGTYYEYYLKHEQPRIEHERQQQQMIGRTAPPLSIERWFNSDPIELSELQGGWVLLYVWATWCGPCEAAIPELNTIHDEFESGPNHIVAIHTRGEDEELAVVERYINEKSIRYPVGVSVDGAKEVCDLYVCGGLPHVVLISPEGDVSTLGELEVDNLLKHIRAEI